MKGACEVASHPRGEVTGAVIKRFGSGAYTRERICPTCGRVQGIALVRPICVCGDPACTCGCIPGDYPCEHGTAGDGCGR